MKPGCLGGSIGCLILGIIIGALAIWLLIPRINQKGYTPDRTAERIEKGMEEISDIADRSAQKVSAGAERLNELKALVKPETDSSESKGIEIQPTTNGVEAPQEEVAEPEVVLPVIEG